VKRDELERVRAMAWRIFQEGPSSWTVQKLARALLRVCDALKEAQDKIETMELERLEKEEG